MLSLGVDFLGWVFLGEGYYVLIQKMEIFR